MSERHILLSGGGTLGPVTPLLAVVEAAREQRLPYRFTWVGTWRGPEHGLVGAYGIPFYRLCSGKWRRYVSVRNALSPLLTGIGFLQAMVLLAWLRPAVVLSAGAYVSVPLVWAAACWRIPVVIHEQDAIDGLANRLMRPFAHLRTSVWPRQGAVAIGNLIRRSIYHGDPTKITRDAAEQKLPVILITGGGTGAQTLNAIALASLPELTSVAFVVHVTGPGKMNASQRHHYLPLELSITDRAHHYAAAEIVVTRAGMANLSELAALNRAAIVVPMPGTHQEANAAHLGDAAVVVPQHELTPARLYALVRELLADPARRRTLGERLHAVIPDGTAAFMDLLARVR